MRNLILSLAMILFCYQAYVGIPHDLLRPGCFDYDIHYAQWYRMPPERIAALREATREGTAIGCFQSPAEDRSSALWNDHYSNTVVLMDPDRSRVEYTETYGNYVISKEWVAYLIPENKYFSRSPDYLYLRSDLDDKFISWADQQLELVYFDEWGRIYRVNQIQSISGEIEDANGTSVFGYQYGFGEIMRKEGFAG